MNVDDREPVRIINELRSKVDDIKVCRLETADYTIGDFGIERKSLTDLLGSVYDTRYWKQIETLKATYPHPCVMLEGMIDATFKGKKREPLTQGDINLIRSVENATVMGFSIPVVHTVDHIDTANRLIEFYQRSEKKHDAPRAVVQKERNPEAIRLSMLQCIDGCGSMTAKRILEKYKLCDLAEITDPIVLTKSVVGLRRDVADRIVKVFD